MLWAMYLVPLARKQALEVYKEVHTAKELEKMNEYRERHQGDLPPLRAMMSAAEKEVSVLNICYALTSGGPRCLELYYPTPQCNLYPLGALQNARKNGEGPEGS